MRDVGAGVVLSQSSFCDRFVYTACIKENCGVKFQNITCAEADNAYLDEAEQDEGPVQKPKKLTKVIVTVFSNSVVIQSASLQEERVNETLIEFKKRRRLGSLFFAFFTRPTLNRTRCHRGDLSEAAGAAARGATLDPQGRPAAIARAGVCATFFLTASPSL